MRYLRTYLLATLLLFLAAGQGAWATRTEPMAFKGRTVTNGNVTMYTWLFQGLLGTASQNATDGNRQTFNNQTISFSKGRLTITGTLIFAVADAFTDVTTGSQVTLVFENTPYWFFDATVKTLSDSPVSGCSTSVSSDMKTITVTIPSGKTFGNVYLDFVPNAPMSSNNTTLA